MMTDTRMTATPYYAVKVWNNGQKETQWFARRDAMLRWLAASPEAGISASDGGVAIDQQELQEDVGAYL
jgi:hypothetical protein